MRCEYVHDDWCCISRRPSQPSTSSPTGCRGDGDTREAAPLRLPQRAWRDARVSRAVGNSPARCCTDLGIWHEQRVGQPALCADQGPDREASDRPARRPGLPLPPSLHRSGHRSTGDQGQVGRASGRHLHVRPAVISLCRCVLQLTSRPCIPTEARSWSASFLNTCQCSSGLTPAGHLLTMLVNVFPIRTRTDTLARAMIEVALHDSPEPGRIFGQAEIERLAASASPGF